MMFLDEFHSMGTSVVPSCGVSQGRGMTPFDVSSFMVERRHGSQGAWPMGVTLAITSETCLDLSVGVETLSGQY